MSVLDIETIELQLSEQDNFHSIFTNNAISINRVVSLEKLFLFLYRIQFSIVSNYICPVILFGMAMEWEIEWVG